MAIALHRLRAVDPRDGLAARNAINVKRIVTALRKQRGGMVQTYEQYLLCYQVLPVTCQGTAVLHLHVRLCCRAHASVLVADRLTRVQAG